MTLFKSPEVTINKNAEYVFNKISNLDNLDKILPDEIKDFQSTGKTCSFTIQGIQKLKLELTEKTEFSQISLENKHGMIPFTLKCIITEKEEKCNVILELNTELNMMTRMMVEKPLTKLLNLLVNNMQSL